MSPRITHIPLSGSDRKAKGIGHAHGVHERQYRVVAWRALRQSAETPVWKLEAALYCDPCSETARDGGSCGQGSVLIVLLLTLSSIQNPRAVGECYVNPLLPERGAKLNRNIASIVSSARCPRLA